MEHGMSSEIALFFMSHHNHIKCFLPVVEELSSTGYGVICATFEECLARDIAEDELKALGRYCETIVLRKSLIQQVLSKVPARYFPRASCDHRMYMLRRAKRLIDILGRGLVTVIVPFKPSSSVFRYIYSVASRHAKVVSIQHLLVLPLPKDALTAFPADLICVWGERMERSLRDNGVDLEIHITGAPHLARRDSISRGHRQDSPLRLLYTTQPAISSEMEEIKRRAIADLVQAREHIANAKLIIKLHPADSGDIEISFLEKRGLLGSEAYIISRDALDEHLEKSDVVITIYSHTAFEALLYSKPVILLNYDNIVNLRVDYLKEGVGLEATDSDSLIRAIHDALFDAETKTMLSENRERYLRECLRFDSRQAVSSICDVIRESAQSERRQK